MTTHLSPLFWIIFMVYMVVGVLCFIFFYFLMNYLLQNRRRRWKKYRFRHVNNNQRVIRILAKILSVSIKDKNFEIYKQLLSGSGIKMDTIYYFIMKKITLGIFIMVGLAAYFMLINSIYLNPLFFVVLLMIAIIGGLVCLLDKSILHAIRKKRSDRIIQEIYVLSNQLLYYGSSTMNLHSKLKRCIRYTKTIRNDMYQLTSEWYEDAEKAINRFKFRLGTDEGISFAETLNSLRLHEDKLYYDLLRQRIQDYKEKIELNKDSKKETNSYVLFILAGIPILNTFRVFVYPWVQEGQRLFESISGKGGVITMRNILMTVMLLMVVVVMFVNIISGGTGIRQQIENRGIEAVTDIGEVSP